MTPPVRLLSSGVGRGQAANVNGVPAMPKALWIVIAVLVALWLAGAVIGFLGDLIHFILVVAVALAVFAFVKRRV